MSNKIYLWSCLVLVVISLLILGWSYSLVISNQNQQQACMVNQVNDFYTKTNSQGAVAVSATWENPEEIDATWWQFHISMDTDSFNLDRYDLKSNATILINNQVVNTGFDLEKWGAGQHIVQVLRVPVPRQGSAQSVTLIIKNLDNIPERVFSWNPRG